MPMIKARYTQASDDAALKAKIAALLSSYTEEILHKDPGVTSALVERADSADWFVAGSSIAKQKVATFYVEVSITQGTNTRHETIEYIRRVYEEMQTLLGPVHEASYILVHGVEGDTYGYGGLTQNLRWAMALREKVR